MSGQPKDWKFDWLDYQKDPNKYQPLLEAAAKNEELTALVGELVSSFDAVRGIDQTTMPKDVLHNGFTAALLIAAVHLGVE